MTGRNDIILIFIFFFFFDHIGYTEGTKQTTPYSALATCDLWLLKVYYNNVDPFGCSAADTNHSIFVTIKSPGEKLYFGFSNFFPYATWVKLRITLNGNVVLDWINLPSSPGPGFIANWNQATAGPNVLNPAGYNPIEFTPGQAGNYRIEFDWSNNWRVIFQYYDFTVVDTTIIPLKESIGRTWSRNWQFLNSTGTYYGFRGTLFVQSYDGMIDSIKYKMGTCPPYALNYNSNGCLPFPSVFENSRKSRTNMFRYPEYRIFFNDPDSTVFPTGLPGNIVSNSMSFVSNCNGQYTISYVTTKSGYVQLFLDINPLPGVQPEDVQLRDSASVGLNTFLWNGLDGLGNPVAVSSSFYVIITFMNGLVNHPLYNTSINDTGFIIGRKRPSQIPLKIYWDDTQISGGNLQLTGCQPTPILGCHSWSGDQYNCSTGFGPQNTINTWWFSGTPDTLHNVSLNTLVETPDSIQGLNSTCFTLNQNYFYSIYPNPLIGAIGYQWKLYNGASLIQSWNTATANINTVIFPGPGIFQLIANGFNNCTQGTADTIQIIVNPQSNVSVSIMALQNNVCSGTPVSFTATPTNPGNTPVYQWKVNGLNAGGNSPVFTYTPVNGDQVQCILTSSIPVCISNNPASSNIISMVVNQLLPVSVSVSASANNVCAGTAITFTAFPVNGGSTPSYQWKVNGVPAGSNSSVYSYVPTNNDAVSCTLSSSETCATGNPATSPAVIMTVNHQLPASVSIAASSNPFCIGTSVAFSAAAVNGGPLAAYQWKVNGTNAGANSSTYAYNPVTGDVVTCILTSSLQCVSGSPASSNSIVMTGTPGLPASVAIAANPNPFCPGSPVAFTAAPGNGGAAPAFQWKVNGANAGSNAATFVYNPSDHDSVRCVMTSNLACVSSNPAISNKVVLSGSPVPHVSFSSCFDTITNINAKPFRLKGGLPLGGTYTGPGVNTVTGMFDPAAAGVGVHQIGYSYTNANGCVSSAIRNVQCLNPGTFTCGNTLTDIRDGKTYPTVQIGSQCWMQANLEFGMTIDEWVPQTDNCTAEYYTTPGDSPSSHFTFHSYRFVFINSNLKSEKIKKCETLNVKCDMRSGGALYQWDELMGYNPTPGSQGLCPPGWHVPTEAEWMILFNFYQGQSRAGKPMQDTFSGGFTALLTGVFYSQHVFSFEDFGTFFWSSTLFDATKAISHGLNSYNYSVSFYPSSRGNALPVRCLRD